MKQTPKLTRVQRSALADFLGVYTRPATIKAYRAALTDYLAHIYGTERKGRRATQQEKARYEKLSDRYLQEIKDGTRDPFRDLETYAVAMNGSVVPTTASLRVSVVKEFFGHHRVKIEAGDVKRIHRRLAKSKAITKETVLTKEIIQSILAHTDIRGRALILFLASSGCRIGEALQLTQEDVDLSQVPARVHLRAETTKTNTERYTFISDEAKAALREWLKVRDQYIERAQKKKFTPAGENPYLFAMSASTAYVIWDLAVQKAGYFGRDARTGYVVVKIHALRKFFRSYIGLAVPGDIAEALIGHAEGLEAIYRVYTPDKLAEEYLKGMSQVTIADIDLETRSRLELMDADNKKLAADLLVQGEELRTLKKLMAMITAEKND